MTTLTFDPMVAIRADAYQQMMDHFNTQALLSLHADIAMLVALAKGEQVVHPIEARDARMQETAKALIAAESAEAVDLALMNMRAPYGSTNNPNSPATGLMSNVPVIQS